MDRKHLTVGALALSIGFSGLAQADDARADQAADVAIHVDDAGVAGCSGECNGECGSGGGGDD